MTRAAALQLAALRATFRSLERTCPRLAGRLGMHYWFRVSPPPPVPRRMRAFTPGEPVSATVDGHLIRGFAWGPAEGPVTYLVHGWAGWWQQLGVYIDPLVAAGHRVVAFDALGHGESEPGRLGPGRGMVNELGDSLRAMAAACGPAHSVVAHSAGGMACMLAVRDGLRPEKVVLLSPSLSVPDIGRFLHDWLHIGPRGTQCMIDQAIGVTGIPVERFDVREIVRGLADSGRLPAGLLIHDADDEETYQESTQELAECWRGAQSLWTRGLGHRRVLWDRDVLYRSIMFITGGDVVSSS